MLPVFAYGETDSTNNEAKRLLKNGEKPPFLVTANAQSAGRGRNENSFYSPADTGVYFSLALNTGGTPSDSVRLTTCAAAAVCKALEALTDIKPQIKWVNDVFVGGKKVCGVLCESLLVAGESSASYVIAGIGINVTTTFFPKDVENAGSLDADIDKTELVSCVCDNLLAALGEPFDEIIAYCKVRSLVLGKEISFVSDNKEYAGKAVDINENGALVVILKNGAKKALTGGEIKIRTK